MNSARPHCLLALLAMICTGVSEAQEYDWWVEKHDWDGVTHWSDYLVFSPSYMGPNALPVPPLEVGIVDTLDRFEVGARTHWSAGDDTQDLSIKYQHAFADGRIAFGAEWMVVEHYVTDTLTRDIRFSRERDPRGISTGDLNVNTLLQLVSEKPGGWGLLLRARLRTASGDNLKGARHTDAPGYSFDLSTGRWFPVGTKTRLRIHATLGFLAYQTNRNDYYQNDCLLFGVGSTIQGPSMEFRTEIAGYAGYLQLDDDPVVLRMEIGTRSDRPVRHRITFQHGLHDWAWTTAGYTISFHL